MTLFDRAARAAHKVHEVIGGELVDLVPMRKSSVNAGSAADPSRDRITVRVTVSEVPRQFQTSDAADPRADNRLGITTSSRSATIALAAVPWVIRQGDRLVRLETGEAFTVAVVHPDGSGHATLILNGAKS